MTTFTDLIEGPITPLLLSMAHASRDFDGSLASFEKEFATTIKRRPDTLGQFGLFSTMVRNIDMDSVKNIASRIRAVQVTRDDTLMLDHYGELMNILTHAYGLHLVRCPQCATIVADTTTYNKKSSITSEIKCPLCDIEFHSSEAPDLFF